MDFAEFESRRMLIAQNLDRAEFEFAEYGLCRIWIKQNMVCAKFGSSKNIMHNFKNKGTFHTFNMGAISILNYKRKKQGQSKMRCYFYHL